MWSWLFADDAPPRPNRPTPQPKPQGADVDTLDPEEEEEEDEFGVGGEINEALQAVLPWMTSLLFHLGIVVLALFLVWSYILIVDEEEMPIIPSAKLSETPGGSPTETPDVELKSSQQVKKVQAENVATEDSVNNLESNLDSELELVGVSGGGGGGKLAPFGMTTGAGSGIGAKFYGTGGNARKIIYIVDASGSLIDTLPFVIKELKRSVSALSDKQDYTVIFFQAGQPVEVPPRGWKKADARNKRSTADWIDLEAGNIVPRGKTDPVSAVKLAMRYKPELVFLLSDNITGRGEYEVDRKDLLKFLNDANADRKTVINTIQFLYPDPLNTLKTIASEHGGVYKFITEESLGLK